MSRPPRDRLAETLRSLATDGSFSARRTAPTDDLAIEVRGVGPIGLPLTTTQARELRLLARPARYGKGEATLLDRRVRDTWEIARNRVKIDKRRWNNTMSPMVDLLARDLGVAEGRKLTAKLQSVLLYEPGQFFAPHQDSEKDDDMIGSLVVILPSNATGGEVVIEHRSRTVTHRSSRSSLTLVAFYSDTRHEIRPVISGWRMALTYRLLIDRKAGETNGGPGTGAAADATPAVAAQLERHFANPADLPSWQRDRRGDAPPDRLVYLLDHEYTERGLSWERLKGDDAVRAAVLRSAAERVHCEVDLALAEVHEIWDAMETDWYPRRGRGRGRWDRPRGNEPLDSDGYELGDLIESDVSVCGAKGASRGSLAAAVEQHELCASTPSAQLQPYESEYEGYMGNYGNTMDRWYRRGAVVVWPRSRSFAVRAKGDPMAALDEVIAGHAEPTDGTPPTGEIPTGGLPTTRENVATLSPFWSEVVQGDRRGGLLSRSLRTADLVDDAELATMLTEPFEIEQLGAAEAPMLVTLADHYGLEWMANRFEAWGSRGQRWPTRRFSTQTDPGDGWMLDLPDLCQAMVGVTTSRPTGDPSTRTATTTEARVAGLALTTVWSRSAAIVAHVANLATPSTRREALGTLGPELGAVLHATVIAGAGNIRDQIVETLCAGGDALLPGLVAAVRFTDELEPSTRNAAGLDRIARHAIDLLGVALARPERSDGDWAIELPAPWHDCGDCQTLATFISDDSLRVFEWPLAKPRRQHIHYVLDAAEVPIGHTTRRTGRPFTLVLTKSNDLWDRERDHRHRVEDDMAALVEIVGSRER